MSKNVVETIKKELRGILRDKKSLLMMLITPLLIPLFIFVFSGIYENIFNGEKEEQYSFGVNYVLNDTEKMIISNLNVDVKYYDSLDLMKKAYDEKEVNAYVLLDNNSYNIYANPNTEAGSATIIGIKNYLDSYNDVLAQSYLASINANIDKVYHNINYEVLEIKGENDLVNIIISFGFIFSIMAITLSAIYGATDATAGEKERGTLETFLTFPVKKSEIIMGKFLAISLSAIITSILCIALCLISFAIVRGMYTIYDEVIFNFNILSVVLTFLIMISYSLFISGLCILIASFSKSYKEAQSALTPISFVVMLPMFLNMLDVEMSWFLSLVPIVNHTMLINDIFIGNVKFINIIIMFVSTVIYILVIIKYISIEYKSEKVLFSN